ncbi:unnamed protein product [Urochloa decumbens]|uniref:Late embryogenesis abundant protein LEA-2 subgroup domain-containing protein n=1 Tax=Urochloa decumbens TaxID=240449 RepID=A0ABC9DTT9_9POAL
MATTALEPLASESTGVKAVNTLNAKHFILAALTATLATAVVVTVVFIVLSPARIDFSVTYATSQHLPGNDEVKLILTVVANNTSQRARVEYQTLFVDVSNFSVGPLWTNYIRANVATALPLHQPTRNETYIHATLALVGGQLAKEFTGGMTSLFTVMVTTVAKFKVGFAPTRPYDIKVSCRPVNFFPKKGAGQSGLPPVKCSG